MYTLAEVIARFGGEIYGDPDCYIRQVATLEKAGEHELAFLANPKYRQQLATSAAAAVIMAPEAVHLPGPNNRILSPQPYTYFARVSQWLNPPPKIIPGVHPTAVIANDVYVPASASIGAYAVLERGVELGESVVIGAHCILGEHVKLGARSRLYPRVTIYAGCELGEDGLIHSGVVIGSDGFGLALSAEGWLKIPQIGRVLIGHKVEIGANTTIDRGALADTVLEDGVKLDNQIQIAHNVTIGAHTAIAACVGIAGSAHIGAHCTLGGGAIVLGHLSLADEVHVSAGTLVNKSITTPGQYTGVMPYTSHAQWRKNGANLRHLDALAQRIHLLEQQLAART